MPIYSGGGRSGREPGPHYGAGRGGSYGYRLTFPAAESSRQEQERRQQEQERQRQHQLQLELAMERAGKLADDWNRYLISRRQELGRNAIHVLLKNDWQSKIRVAVLFESPDPRNPCWITLGWYFVEPWSTLRTNVVTTNPNMYFFGVDENEPKYWDGTDQNGSISASVVSSKFACKLGTQAEGMNERTLTCSIVWPLASETSRSHSRRGRTDH